MESTEVRAAPGVAILGIQPPKISRPAEDLPFLSVPPHTAVKKLSKQSKHLDDHEPLIDTTAALRLRSKKTERLQKKTQKKQKKGAARPETPSLLVLPAELLQEIFGYLKPTDLLRLQRTNRPLRDFVLENGNSITRQIVCRRYSILKQCFPLPIPFNKVDPYARPGLLSDKRQNMLNIHRKGYQHVTGVDPHKICSCMSCLLAWNNLNMIVDLGYWQRNLNSREPIPMIPRGRNPDWNLSLLASNAAAVEQALINPIAYALILELHLDTTIGTLMRTYRGKKPVHNQRPRLYQLTQKEANVGTDEFLSRVGPESHEFPYQRDNYYNLEAYIPNRKWSKEQKRWIYYAEGLHERDLQWVKDRFTPASLGQKDFDALMVGHDAQQHTARVPP